MQLLLLLLSLSTLLLLLIRALGRKCERAAIRVCHSVHSVYPAHTRQSNCIVT